MNPGADGNALPPGWAPKPAMYHATATSQAHPRPSMAPEAPMTSAFGPLPSPPSAAPSGMVTSEGSGTRYMLRASDLRVQPPVPQNNSPAIHHHHYIPTPTPTSSGRATPISVRSNSSSASIPNTPYGSTGPSHGRPSANNGYAGPANGHILPSIEIPGPGSSSANPHAHVAGDQRLLPDLHPSKFSIYPHPPPPPPPLPMGPIQQHQPATQRPPSQQRPPTGPATAAAAAPQRRLDDGEVNRLQRFMSMNWKVGVINHPPPPPVGHPHYPTYPTSASTTHGRGYAPPTAGFVGHHGHMGNPLRPH